MISFTVVGRPVPWGRARVGNARGRLRFHTPAKVRGWQERVAWHAKKAMGPLGPTADKLTVELLFYRGGRACDCDNLVKAILDSLSKIVWHDDVQVKRIVADYLEPDELGERVEILCLVRG